MSKHGLDMIQFWDFADYILSIKGIAILADNQDPPAGIWASPMNVAEHDGQQVVLHANFKKVI